jgi:tetratricopeptide (TPR) repeat protein
MRTRLPYLTLPLILLALAAPVALSRPGRGGRLYVPGVVHRLALVVGIENYRGLQPFAYGKNDARAVRDFLVNEWGYHQDAVTLMTDDTADQELKPTRENLQAWTRSAMPFISADTEQVVIYFAGHGMGAQGQDWLVPVDAPANLTANPVATCVSATDLVEALKRKKPQQALLCFDASRQFGSFGRTLQASPAPQFGVLLASHPGVEPPPPPPQVSRVQTNPPHGMFTRVLLELLSQPAEPTALDQAPLLDDDGRLTFMSLAKCVRQEVAKEVSETYGGAQQEPVGTIMGDMVLREYPDEQPTLRLQRLVREGFAALDAGRWQEAEDRAVEALKVRDLAEVYFLLGKARLGTAGNDENKLRQAVDALEEARSRKPELAGLAETLADGLKRLRGATAMRIPALLDQADAALAGGNAEAAARTAGDALLLTPKESTELQQRAHYILGRCHENTNQGRRPGDPAYNLEAEGRAIEEYQQAGNYPGAQDGLGRLVRLRDVDRDLLCRQAEQLVKDGQFSEAETAARNVLAREARGGNPNSPLARRAHRVLGRVHLAAGRWTDAKAAFEAGEDADGVRSAEAALAAGADAGRAEKALEDQQSDRAKQEARAALDRKSVNKDAAARAQFVLGKVAEQERKPVEAWDAYQESVRLNPGHQKAGEAAAALKGNAEVAALEQRRLGERRRAARDLAAEALEAVRAGQHRQAEVLAGRSLDSDPDGETEARAYAARGNARIYLGDLENGLADVRKASQSNAADRATQVLAKVGEGTYEYYKRDYAAAETLLRGAAGQDPRDVMALNNLGAVYFTQAVQAPEGRKADLLDRAAAEYRKVIGVAGRSRPGRLMPNSVDMFLVAAHYNLGAAYWERGKKKDAAREFQKAVEMWEQNARFHVALAAVHYEDRKPDKARDEIRRARQLDPEVKIPSPLDRL